MNATIKTAPEPPRVIACLLSGFDAISNHVGLILFPVALDLFLWLGPRVRLSTLLGNLLDDLSAMQSLPTTSDDARLLQVAGEYWSEIAARANLFATLRSYPVGVSSLVAGSPPLQTPLGIPSGWEMSSFLAVLGLWFAFNLLGIAVGALYFSAVSQAALHGKVDWKVTLSQWPRTSLQVFLLTVLWALILVVVAIPGSCMVSLISLVGLSLGQFAVYLVGGLALWVLFPIVFSPHGIFYKQRLAWVSVRDSVRITRLTAPQTVLLFVIILLINEGLGFLWRIPGETSWLMLVGVIGHAFIATGLLAASFIYYRDAERWVNRLLIQSRLSTTA
jgi:hypothetical protein